MEGQLVHKLETDTAGRENTASGRRGNSGMRNAWESFEKIFFGIIYFSLVSLTFPIFYRSNLLNINIKNILEILQQDYST